MSTVALLAPGESMSQALADRVRGRCQAIALTTAYELAPWADALASQDKAWWMHHSQALQFAGRKFSVNKIDGVEQIEPSLVLTMSSSSGVLAMEVAKRLGCLRILLLGFDMRGGHYFGKHPEPLKNTTPRRYDVFKTQLRNWGRINRQIEILNCTPGSALTCFPFANIEDVLVS